MLLELEGDLIENLGELATTRRYQGEFHRPKEASFFKAFGAGKRLRGMRFGRERPDLVILDDLENNTNARYRPQRDGLVQWLDTAVLNLGRVAGDLDAYFIGSLLHRDSVLAHKLKLKFWHPNMNVAYNVGRCQQMRQLKGSV